MTVQERNTKEIKSLDPVFQPIAESIISECKAEGVDVLITDGYRSYSAQKAIFDAGLVNAARPGYSFHNYGMAIDVVPLTEGQPDYSASGAYAIIGKVAKRHGCEWGGDWKGEKIDKPHIQYTQGLTIEDVRAGKKLLYALAPQKPSWTFQHLSIEQMIVITRKALNRSEGLRKSALKRKLERLLENLG